MSYFCSILHGKKLSVSEDRKGRLEYDFGEVKLLINGVLDKYHM